MQQVTPGSRRGIPIFFASLALLAVARILLQSFVDVPAGLLTVANFSMSALFLGGPLLALCFAARDPWTPKTAALFVVLGVVVQVGCFLVNAKFINHASVMFQVINAIGQIGLPIWCVGLGALLATLCKDKNILVPIAIFLAFLDMFLVFSPFGVTNRVITHYPGILNAVAVQIPSAVRSTTPGHAVHHVRAGSLAGPADFLFLAMFLIALFRFQMKGKQTVMIVIPTLIAYMVLVTITHFSLPALVPIGLVVLVVNWREFKLTKDEKMSTALVGALGLGLFIWGMFQKPTVEPAEPSPTPAVQGAQAPPATPGPVDPGQS